MSLKGDMIGQNKRASFQIPTSTIATSAMDRGGSSDVYASAPAPASAPASTVMAARVAYDVVQYMLPSHEESLAPIEEASEGDDWSRLIDALLANESIGVVDHHNDGEHLKEPLTTPVSPVHSGCLRRGGERSDEAADTATDQEQAQTETVETIGKRVPTSKRRRDEITELRATVEQLKQVLACEAKRRRSSIAMKRSDALVARSATGACMTWEQMAAQQYTARREAEMENVRLRMRRDDELARALRVLEHLEHLPLDYSTEVMACLRLRADRLLTSGCQITYMACDPVPRLTVPMREERVRLVAMLVEQADLVFASPWYRAVASDSTPFRHVDLRNDPDSDGVALELHGTYAMPFEVKAVSDVIWTEPARVVGLLHEEEQDGRITRLLECDKHWNIPGQGVDMWYRMTVGTGRFQQKNEDDVVMENFVIAGIASPIRTTPASPSFACQVNDWVRIRPARRGGGNQASPTATPPLTLVQWCRRSVVTIPQNEPLTKDQQALLRRFAEDLATHFADDIVFCERVADSILRQQSPS